MSRGRGPRPCAARRFAAAFTLLELMLALGLTAVLLITISMAIDLHLRSFDSRRNFLEESQLARAILQVIANDIRGAVVYYEQDVSTIESLLGSASQGGGQSGGGAAGGGGGDAPAGGSTPAPDAGGSADAAGSGGGDISAALSEADLSSLLGEELSTNTTDLAMSVTIPERPGIYGNQYELQVDVSRLPREDEYQSFQMGTDYSPEATLQNLSSDVKTVTYYVLSGGTTSLASAPGLVATDLASASDPAVAGQGLVRRELDRAVTQWAMNSGNLAGLDQTGEVIAPEVLGIEFMYFDGLEWRTEWDTATEEKLPVAVQVMLAIQSTAAAGSESVSAMTSNLDVSSQGGVTYYRLVVHLPTASSEEAQATSDTSTMGM